MRCLRLILSFSMVALIPGLWTGCATKRAPREELPPPSPEVPALRVGITPNFPPVIYNQRGKLAGIELELMRMVGRELRRPVKAVVLPWDELIDSLLSGHVDVIMSGMSITEPRKMRVAFTKPWMSSGLMALVRRAEADGLQSAGDVLRFAGQIGVVPGTTGHAFVRKSCANAHLVEVATPNDAAVLLQRNQIDLFVDDIPSIFWQASIHEADLSALMVRLTQEQIAWAVRRDQTKLLAELNMIIDRRLADGSIDAIIEKFIPYYQSIK